MQAFDQLVAEAAAVDVSGWDFGWLEGRAIEQRPSWGYQRLISDRLGAVSAALDVQTGGGEVLGGAARFPATMVATESWPPNVALATKRLHPRGVVVAADPDEPPLPFADEAFDLVTSRHPASVWWGEIARVLRPGGTYLAQHVGPRSLDALYEFFLGPQEEERHSRHPDVESADAHTAGLNMVTLRMERLRVEFFRRRRGRLLLAEGHLDGAGLHRRSLPRSAPRPGRADPLGRAIRCAFRARVVRGPPSQDLNGTNHSLVNSNGSKAI